MGNYSRTEDYFRKPAPGSIPAVKAGCVCPQIKTTKSVWENSQPRWVIIDIYCKVHGYEADEYHNPLKEDVVLAKMVNEVVLNLRDVRHHKDYLDESIYGMKESINNAEYSMDRIVEKLKEKYDESKEEENEKSEADNGDGNNER